jgi:hypothetical protein
MNQSAVGDGPCLLLDDDGGIKISICPFAMYEVAGARRVHAPTYSTLTALSVSWK